MKTDTEILDWLERMHNLHTEVVALYCVDCYVVSLQWDGETIIEFKGETLRQSYSAAMCVEYNKEQRRFEYAN